MNEISTEKDLDLLKVKAVFDEILVKHIQRLLEIETLAASLSFNLSTISCLLLLVERENEIKNFSQSPPDRYTRETFLDDLSDIGLDIDDTLMVSFQGLAQHGYVEIDQNNRYNAQISAFALVSFLDNLFPGMKGMNLVGYILQMIAEVSSKRKDLNDAIQQFDKTLQLRGIPLSQQPIKIDEKNSLTTQPRSKLDQKAAKQLSDDLQKAYAQNIEKLRNKMSQSSSPQKEVKTTWSDRGLAVKEIFPKGPSEEEIQARIAAEIAIKESESKAIFEAEKKAALEEAKRAAREAELKATEVAAQAAEIRAREAELRAKEAEIAAREAEASLRKNKEVSKDVIEKNDSIGRTDIEEKIAAFQETIAISCPVCNTGKVLSNTTEKGQEYYSCSNTHCGFISWGKPYPFECPLCKNQFLIEINTEGGQNGLKCPRSTCSFRQNHLGPPKTDIYSSPPKKKKLVRVRKKR
ncbi:MAG: DNA topoisomerase I [Desulfobacterium sp.]|nr:DNA topoisomerase I [Desulfobacterium sp.]